MTINNIRYSIRDDRQTNEVFEFLVDKFNMETDEILESTWYKYDELVASTVISYLIVKNSRAQFQYEQKLKQMEHALNIKEEFIDTLEKRIQTVYKQLMNNGPPPPLTEFEMNTMREIVEKNPDNVKLKSLAIIIEKKYEQQDTPEVHLRLSIEKCDVNE